MSNVDREIFKAIVHYQECLEKYAKREDESRMLYCISKLHKLPVTIDHLTETGVGRSVNSLRKISGDVGDHAKSLVAKWKEMVAREGDEVESKQTEVKADVTNKTDYKEDEEQDEEGEEEEEEELNSSKESKSSSSDTKESDRRSRHSSKDHNSKTPIKDKDKVLKHTTKHKDSPKIKDGDSNKYKSKKDLDSSDVRSKHKSSKRKHEDDDNSDKHKKSSKSMLKHESDSDDMKKSAKQKYADNNKCKSPKRKRTDSDNHTKHHDKSNNKRKSDKRKYNSDSDDDQEDEESDESEEIEEIKKYSSKSHTSHKDDKHKNKSKDKKDGNVERYSKDRGKSKHSSKEKTKSEKDSTKSRHSSKQSSKDRTLKTLTSSSKSKVSVPQDGIGSGSGTSFAEALGMLAPSGSSSSKVNKKKAVTTLPLSFDDDSSDNDSSPETIPAELNLLTAKKLEPLNINISSLLPEITPNYKPIGHMPSDAGSLRNKINTDDDTLSAIMYNKISRTKVYSGNKVGWGKVTSLFDLCTRVLQDNIDALEFTGGVPYSILKPVLERANYNQLFMLEQYNPYLMEDTDELWQQHCQRDFRNRSREEMETWRDMYQRCLDERENKLRALTANIKQSQDKSIPVRQTKLAYVDSVVKPPRNVARKQARHGTGSSSSQMKKPITTPSSRLVALATAGAAGEVSVPNPSPRSSGISNAAIKPKKAPLMQKTLALMKNRFRR